MKIFFNISTFSDSGAAALLEDFVNGLDTGRNAKEVLRTLKAIKAGGLTGCEWNPGEDFVA